MQVDWQTRSLERVATASGNRRRCLLNFNGLAAAAIAYRLVCGSKRPLLQCSEHPAQMAALYQMAGPAVRLSERRCMGAR